MVSLLFLQSMTSHRGTSHGNQSDIQFLSLFSELRAQFPSSRDPYTAFRINVDLCHAFYRRHLLRGAYLPTSISEIASLKDANPTIII